ncbi:MULTISPECIES: undecaprenyl-phosphate glucose phosphotransferase [unclassified Flavobacterium]|uniref:undecaprenyl-phosphate glucose phosphotransferase n=1 Tax=unclassified Flavobacterium TaxID=196869 RepID=UPI00086CCC39|nr:MULTISPECIES: undecaprenyl-phosphate glucose phosphotransferase [unclassified Flavobacterium]MBN9285348.1 undecaprenyl-phosphate glucose phosphotransferase [Flavobacterium sp.]ODS82890.1 MAG: undecaprenyl-phosphate glucose phosphotransferase [Chryseobacterium sp. SCN 40-13]OJV71631.1 MAG: undecaprenyl-phosphate glucose phosphotransferase [Flavobacterium sp. 40-81]
MRRNTGRYSGYIRPFSYLLDLIIINVLTVFLLPQTIGCFYNIFISIAWIIVSFNIGFYEVYRYTKAIEILGKILKQYLLFLVLSFAYIGYFSKYTEPSATIKYTTISIALIALFKLAVFYFLKRFRVVFGGNFRRVVIVGHSKNVVQLKDFFNDNPDYGYKLEKVFNVNNKEENIEACLQFVLDKNVDEIYCSLSDLTNKEVNQFVDFTDNNLKILKFLPDSKEILSRNLVFDYYGYIPIISMRNIPLDKSLNKIIKRIFDIFFASFIILGLLSWLTPLLAIFIKMESKGPIFFKQKRNGLNYKEFNCYKFRSMRPNEIADLEQVSKNDPRITRIGRFIRKTSIDELPQFFNVLLGDMSVVGPRPHMVSHTEMYARSVDKFMVRHFIKPGITGLAQTNGYRGEVENNYDIINRVKYDIFYLENWSLLLDLKIIFLTVYNAVKGDEKAY